MSALMRVALFVTCLVDQLWPSVGVATVAILRRAGCEVSFDARQTCCGQPAHNSGWPEQARRVARSLLDVYGAGDFDALVLPSGSCCAMLRHLPELFEPGDPDRARAAALAARAHELSSFLVDVLGVTDLGARFEGRVAWHDACHGLRELRVSSQPRLLLRSVAGCELVEVEGSQTCCGFGGTFSIKLPELSVAMADSKLEALERAGLDAVVSGDVSCLMQLGGRLERRGSRLRALHLAEVLAGSAGARA
jgi:L-lactate dehydrogenase complex protein LldE